ncbi:MAG: GNAT family N-acetyltransferase [Actinobacteria bacterium]|nr:GNAT family N-acetyltransferase [Actinomycetota bacterium]
MTDETTSRRDTAPTARVATDADVEALGAMFARGFADDPVWEWLCEARMRLFTRRATPFFAAEVRQHLDDRTVWTVPGVDAGAIWAPPGAWRTTLGDLARWAPSALRLFGRHLPRSLGALGQVDKLHPREPHFYLALLATDPDRQGHGLGSAVLRPVLERCDAEGIPAYLESSKERNVPFYERHGFEVTGTITMGGGGSGPPLWLMWREPRPPES